MAPGVEPAVAKHSVGNSVSGRRKMDIVNDIKKKLLVKYGQDKFTEMAIDTMLHEFNQKKKVSLKDFTSMESQLHGCIRSIRNSGGQNIDAFKGLVEMSKGKTFDGLKAQARAQRSESLTKDSLSYQKRKDQQQQGVAAIYSTNGALKSDVEHNNERQLQKKELQLPELHASGRGCSNKTGVSLLQVFESKNDKSLRMLQ